MYKNGIVKNGYFPLPCLDLSQRVSMSYDASRSGYAMANNGSDDNEEDDDEQYEIRQNFGHPDNHALLRIMANYVIESRHHTVRLRSLYDQLRMLPFPAEGAWGEKVLEEEERHYRAAGENLQKLKKFCPRPRCLFFRC